MHLAVYIITAIAYAFAGCYVLYILFFYLGFRRLKRHELKEDKDLPPLTIIVCAKDEEENIGSCLDSILRQNYPKEKYSIIAVNDRSEDRTGEILNRYEKDHPQIKVLHITACPAGISPKKHAISQAINICRTEYVVASDADTQHHENWLRSYGSLCHDQLGAATSISYYKKDTFRSNWEKNWQSMQTLENLSYSMVIAGAMANGFAITAQGGNMMYRRDLFENNDTLKNNVVTGDDSYIVYEAQRRKLDVVFNAHPAAITKVIPENNIKSVINQRIRWASHVMKATFPVIVLGLTVFFFYLSTLLLPFLAFIDIAVLPYWGGLVLIKAACDFFYMTVTLKKFEIPYKFRHLFLMELFHSLFIVWVGLYGTFGTFTWKGESYTKTLKDK